jgi:hypothetical protein
MMAYYESLTMVSRAVVLAVSTMFLWVSPAGAGSGESLINKGADHVAIEGYDTVAYFTEDRAVKGSKDYEFEWHDARWHFSSDKHRDLFASDPERYAPQFGGLCAGAMRRGVVVKADPEAWTIVDGKLYMKVNKEFRDEWRQDPANNIKQANEAWAQKTGKK